MKSKRLLAKAGLVAGMGLGLAFAAGGAADAAASVTVTPASGLTDGQTVTVSGSGLTAGDVFHIGECTAITATSFACGPGSVDVTSDSTGSLSAPLTVHQAFTGTAADGSTHAVDCTQVQCVIGVFDDAFDGAAVNVSFG